MTGGVSALRSVGQRTVPGGTQYIITDQRAPNSAAMIHQMITGSIQWQFKSRSFVGRWSSAPTLADAMRAANAKMDAEVDFLRRNPPGRHRHTR